VYYGTKEGSVCLTSTSPLIPFVQEGIRYTMISRPHIGGME
jgi:hypothetical protein